MKKIVFVILLNLICFTFFSQENRDPRSKELANFNWNGDFDLFSLDSDLLINSDSSGLYHFWYASIGGLDDLKPKLKSVRKQGKAFPIDVLAYKFITFEECLNWCNRERSKKGFFLLEPQYLEYEPVENFFAQLDNKEASTLVYGEVDFTHVIQPKNFEWSSSLLTEIINRKRELTSGIKQNEAVYNSYQLKVIDFYKSQAEEWYQNARNGKVFSLTSKQLLHISKKKLLSSNPDKTQIKSIDPNSLTLISYLKDGKTFYGIYGLEKRGDRFLVYRTNVSSSNIIEFDKYIKNLGLIKLKLNEVKTKLKYCTNLDDDYFNSKNNLQILREDNYRMIYNNFSIINKELLFIGTDVKNGGFSIALNSNGETIYVGYTHEFCFPEASDNFYKIGIKKITKNITIAIRKDYVFCVYAPNGEIYTGHVSANGSTAAYGTYFFENGAYYDGWWEEGNRNGTGTLHFKNGETWSGEWKNNKLTGMGKKTYANGRIEDGLFENNNFIKSREALEQERIAENRRVEEERIAEVKRVEAEKIRQDKINEANSKAFWALIKQAGEQESNSNNSHNQQTQSSHSSACSVCKGTGECSNCSKSVKKSYLDNRCAHKQTNETNLGNVICSTCHGFGYITTSINCNCPNGIGMCYEKDCSNGRCNNGWMSCGECNYKGVCKYCKGTGSR